MLNGKERRIEGVEKQLASLHGLGRNRDWSWGGWGCNQLKKTPGLLAEPLPLLEFPAPSLLLISPRDQVGRKKRQCTHVRRV